MTEEIDLQSLDGFGGATDEFRVGNMFIDDAIQDQATLSASAMLITLMDCFCVPDRLCCLKQPMVQSHCKL